MSRLNAFLDAASVDDPRLRRAKPAPAPRQANARQVPHRRPPAPPPPPPPKRPPTPPILPAHELKLLIEEILSAQQTEEECPCEENPVRQQQPQQPPNQKDELLDLQNELVAKDFEWEEEFASLGAKQRTARPQNRMFECRICLEMVPVEGRVGGVIGEEIVQSLGLEEELLRAYAELQVLQFSVRVECRRSSCYSS
ncbi:hypothetical protein AX16_010389 [Volvariella volvacea WC 439]|nr:hypothetical protein AX16_010389 [Volvariella volvacea WC 439]